MATRITTMIFLVFACSLITMGQERLSCGTTPPTRAQKAMLEQQFTLERQLLSRIANRSVTEIAIVAHIIRRDDGTGGISESELNEALDNVNAFYSNANLSFFYITFNYIDETQYFDFITSDEGEMRSKYNYDGMMNVYFANSVGDGDGGFFCGYAYFPGGPDVILMDNGCTMNGSTYPHEIGHFFSLYHTHGTTNTGTTDELVVRPGEEAGSNGSLPANCETAGDRLCDTEADPNVSGKIDGSCNYTGNEVDENGDAFIPDGTNIMSYSTKACRDLFADGQYDRMDATYLSSRNYLHTKRLYAEIDAESTEICQGASITFDGERSINAVSYNWTFEGGTPSTSSDANPVISYAAAGDYDVSLTITDSEGDTDSQSISDYVTIKSVTSTEATSAAGSFEEVSITEDVINEDGSTTWATTSAAATQGSNSVYMNFFEYSNVGQEDYLILATLNTTVVDAFELSFDYAYAQYDDSYSDGMEVVYRDQCGDWQSIFSQSGSELATGPDQTSSLFVPSSDQWATLEFFIQADEGTSVMEIAIKAINGYGNALYVDNYLVQSFTNTFNISNVEVTNASCSDVADGSIFIALSEDYTYEYYLDGVSVGTNSTLSSVLPGTYSLTVQNEFGYQQSQQVTIGYDFEYPDLPVISEDGGVLSIDDQGEYEIQWYFNGVEIVGETSTTFSTGGEIGSYSVSVTNGTCTISSEAFLILSVENWVKDVTLYPNPVSQVLNLSISDELSREIESISIQDLSGRRIMIQEYQDGIDVSQLKSGIYFLTLVKEDESVAIRFLKR